MSRRIQSDREATERPRERGRERDESRLERERAKGMVTGGALSNSQEFDSRAPRLDGNATSRRDLNSADLQLLLVLEQMDVLMIGALVTGWHGIRMGHGAPRAQLHTRWRRYEQLWSRFLHVLVHTVDTVHRRAAGTRVEIRQKEERTETHDTERQKHQQDQILLTGTERPSREQGNRHTVHEPLIRRQNARRRCHFHDTVTTRTHQRTSCFYNRRKPEHSCALLPFS